MKNDYEKIFTRVSTALYLVVSSLLMLVAVALIAAAIWQAIDMVRGGASVVLALLDASKLIVIGLAVFDVGNYFMEEEVLRDRELRSPTEARRTMTKFMVIICIVVSLEAVLSLARINPENLGDLLYPAILLVSAVVVMVGLGVYQRLSSKIETRDGDGPPAPVKAARKRASNDPQ